MACSSPPQPPPLTLDVVAQHVEDDVLFIGLSVVDDQTAWLSGTRSTVARTTDGGENWNLIKVAPEDSLQYRDVHAVDADRAFILSIGTGSDSRIYFTEDGGESWTLQFQNPWETGFFDCLDFWDPMNGIAFSDAVDGAFLLIRTSDGGKTWERIPPDVLPPALPGEGAFASSGTCLVTHGDSTAWVGTGASGEARLLRTTDRGASWDIANTPMPQGTPTAGFTSLSILPDGRAAAAGGEILAPDSVYLNVGISDNAGDTWTMVGHPTFTGAIYSIAHVPGASSPTLVAAGPKGLAYSPDNGVSWTAIDSLNYWTVGFDGQTTGWAAGTEGKILKLIFAP